MKKNVVLGGSGLVGCSFRELVKENKKYILLVSKTNIYPQDSLNLIEILLIYIHYKIMHIS